MESRIQPYKCLPLMLRGDGNEEESSIEIPVNEAESRDSEKESTEQDMSYRTRTRWKSWQQ